MRLGGGTASIFHAPPVAAQGGRGSFSAADGNGVAESQEASAEVTTMVPARLPGFQLVPELSPLPNEVIFDKITMSAFEATPLDVALRDCGINSFIIVGVATEIGIEPTIRHGADLGYIPIVVTDACGAGHEEAGERALESIKFIGDAILTDIQAILRVLNRMRPA